MLTDINESGLDVHPHVGLDLPPTHQPAVYQLRLPRETAFLCSTVLPYDPTDRRFSKSQDERLACWCVYGILQDRKPKW